MTKKNLSNSDQHQKVGAGRLLPYFTMIIVFFFFAQYTIIPNLFSSFVVPLFKPSDEKLAKMGFVKFDGLVNASTSKEKEALLAGKNSEISKESINREYVFDFSWKARSLEKDGYAKKSTEWYVRSEVLGENAIILEPWIGATILAIDIALVLATLISVFLPKNVGLFAFLIDRQIDETKVKIRLQTGFTDEIVELLTMPDDKLREKYENEPAEVKKEFRAIWNRTIVESMEVSNTRKGRFEDFFQDDIDIVLYRNRTLYDRIKEFFSDFLEKEINDTKNAMEWRKNQFALGKGLRLYMSHHITEKYQNMVTGFAYGGAAFLIVAVGIRGLKFIPATKPSFILLAIFLEFTMLSLLAFTLIYTEEEERMDKMLKKMEDANRSQLDALRGQQSDIHQLANALVGQTADIIKARVEEAVSQYMTTANNMEKAVANTVANKIMLGLREVVDKEANER